MIFWLENYFLCVRIEICYRILSEQVFSFNYQGGILVNGILCILQWLWNAEVLLRKNIEQKKPQEMSTLPQFPKLNVPSRHTPSFQLDLLLIERAQWVFMEMQWPIQGCSWCPWAVAVLHPAAPWACLQLLLLLWQCFSWHCLGYSYSVLLWA